MPDEELGTPGHIFTWVDVDAHLAALAAAGRWPEWVLECDAFWDGLEVTVAPDASQVSALSWLSEVFGVGSLFQDEQPLLRLDDVPGRPSTRLLPIAVHRRDVEKPRREPRWRERRIVASLSEPLPRPGAPFAGDVRVAALHSFKGGVGRTLHGVALAEALAQRGGRVLLVDADLEAPGITWMFGAHGRRVDFGYEDFLALLHSSENGRPDDAVRLGAAYLPNQMMGNVIVMPTRRSLYDIAPPRLEPTDLLTPDRSIYYLTESLAELADRLGARTVLIDLRAGSSELAAPILLDPRIQRIFVTTVSSQSLHGTVRTIQQLGRRAPSGADDPASVAVITQFREDGHRELAMSAATRLRDAISGTLERLSPGRDDLITDRDVTLEPIFSVFQDRLLALPESWEAVTDLVRRQHLSETLASLADELLPAPEQVRQDHPSDGGAITIAVQPDELAIRRNHLTEFAQRLVYAETAEDADFLPTESLRNILTSHRTEPPLCVVTGAKGSGKTFTQLQMCFRHTWRRYADDVGVSGVTLDAPLAPVLVSKHLSDSARERIDEIQQGATTDGGPGVATQLALHDLVDGALRSELTNVEWRRVWLTCMARVVGIDATPADVEHRLIEFAAENTRIFLFDGLEDLLQDLLGNEIQRQALRVLLIDCIDWLRSLRGRPLGLIIFVRRDLVQSAIRQNHQQFFARYSDYELKWNHFEALRLALWVTQRSGALPELTADQVAAARNQSLSTMLHPLWGEKMGSPRSREARSDGWFLAALSDFNDQIQARDIVTFLKESAAHSAEDVRSSTRLLTPAAMRKALVQCSLDKIRAITEESPQVGAILQHLQSLPAERKRIPFSPEAVELTTAQLEVLAANGVVFREEDEYWIPEIFRHGLAFKATGRPKILAIANLVRQRNNLD
ncbi:KGGVGR-motif variant AAA ATPase [Sphaerisporangium rufum]|nr:P-loop NTPase [Sphaerisporangium rufum]